MTSTPTHPCPTAGRRCGAVPFGRLDSPAPYRVFDGQRWTVDAYAGQGFLGNAA